MKFTLSWIREFVDLSGAIGEPAELARRLTSVGLPVETITDSSEHGPVLDIEVFSNRPDCMNVYGVARETAAATGRELLPYPVDLREEPAAPPASTLATVSIQDTDLCGRYTARVMRGVTVGPSPAWLRDRLVSIGMRPVNNIVDVTNFVLWEFGHPLHAFDRSTLAGHRIVVRRAVRGESITTLDGIHRPLAPEMLVIADAERPVAIAGVMGGAATMVSESTVDLVLESAWFSPASIRRTSKQLSLSSDASYRFERGADIEATTVALDRAAALIKQVAGGEICPGVLEQRSLPASARRIRLRADRVPALLGLPVEGATIERVLGGLGFVVEKREGLFSVLVPSHRQDVEQEVDLIEEVARGIGYDAIPERLPHIPGNGGTNRAGHRRETALREALLATGFSEASTSSFASSTLDAGLRGPGPEPIALSNPIAADQEILRTTLLPGLLASVARNINHGIHDVRLFEIGRVFRRAESSASAGPVGEIPMLAVAMSGGARRNHWSEKRRDVSFYDLKGVFESLMAACGAIVTLSPLDTSGTLRLERALLSISAEGAADWSKVAGRIGLLNADWRKRLDISQEVVVAELDLAELFALPSPVIRFTPLPRFPAVSRDLSLIVPKDQPYSVMESAVRAVAPGLVSQVSVFDRYPGASLPAGTVGISINIVYQHPERTLSTQEVADLQERILDTLSGKHGAILRQ